jgi:hypothetical protein
MHLQQKVRETKIWEGQEEDISEIFGNGMQLRIIK